MITPRAIGVLAVAVLLLGCDDSRWGSTKRAQTNNAAHSMRATKRVGWPRAESECAAVVKLTRGK